MRPQKITFGEMRDDMGVHGVLVCCAGYRCGHSVALSADRWADDLRLSDNEPRFVCAAAASAADVRPDFNWNKTSRPGDDGISEYGERLSRQRWRGCLVYQDRQ
jgi:hypothetical protein